MHRARAFGWSSTPIVPGRRGKVVATVIAVLLVLGLTLLVLLNQRNVNSGLNAPIQFDDFAFTVRGVRKTTPEQRIGPKSTAGKVDLVVTLEIWNRAKRVDYTFDDSFPVLIDARGTVYHVSPEAQKALDSASGRGNPAAKPLPAGSKVTRDLVFEVPADLEKPRLKILMGGRAGDILETVFFGRKQFLLP
jgi:hypothetical protein